MQKVDQLQEDHVLQLAFQHNLTLKTASPEALAANKSEEEMGNHPSQTPKYGQEYGSKDITADLPVEHKDNPDEPNASQETEDECYHRLRQNEIQILQNWTEALGKESDTIATVVVDHFISTFVDDEFFGSQRDPHSYTQTVMRGIMSDDGL